MKKMHLAKGYFYFTEDSIGEVAFRLCYSERSYFSREFIPREGMLKSNEEMLIPLLENLNIRDIIPMEKKEQLAYYHYRKENIDWYFFVNEGLTDTIFINIRFRDKREACFYDPMTGEFLKAVQRVCSVSYTHLDVYKRQLSAR